MRQHRAVLRQIHRHRSHRRHRRSHFCRFGLVIARCFVHLQEVGPKLGLLGFAFRLGVYFSLFARNASLFGFLHFFVEVVVRSTSSASHDSSVA